MSHYKSNRRDIEFNLFEVLDRQQLLGSGPFAEVDEEVARDMLAEADRLATGPGASGRAAAADLSTAWMPSGSSSAVSKRAPRTSTAGLSTRMIVSRSRTEPEVRSVPAPGTASTSAGAS